MDELTPIQAMILQAIESALRSQGALAANIALHIAGLCESLPHPIMIEWTGVIVMAYDAEQELWNERRAEIHAWYDTQESLEASVRL